MSRLCENKPASQKEPPRETTAVVESIQVPEVPPSPVQQDLVTDDTEAIQNVLPPETGHTANTVDFIRPMGIKAIDHMDSPAMSIIQKIARDHKISEDDFEFHDLIGVGGFSRVYLAHVKGEYPQNQIYAIKTVSKFQFKEDHWDQFLTELKILSVVSNTPCKFLTHLYCSFQSDYNLYFCLEYVPGGSLRTYLDQQRTFDVQTTTFVAAEILLGLLYLHEKLDIVHRDLKPENVLISEDGHCKLTDFGLSKIGKIESYSFCGTLNYLAPELTKKQPYNKMVDFWMLGIIIYEMLVGRTPFAHRNKKTMLDMINAGCYRSNEVKDPVARDLISKLLVVDPNIRLGAQSTKELVKHPFFRSVDLKNLMRRSLPSPLKDLVVVRSLDEGVVSDPNVIPDGVDDTAALRPRLEKFSWIKLKKMPSDIDTDFLDN